ncbi:glycosyltransferase family A protein [Pikeienuella sp. HZG-20]|uniref:glycosyltransferase family A protein n=1 Tax=Paludibacillus litoralis TaxID=3133267 RepID=UPI0030EF3AD6
MSSFDVAIPNYNYGRYLRTCVASVASQDVDALRILIIDNASTDDSARIAREIADADPRVEARIRPRNLGPHASFNEAVDWAASDYFLILCADDRITPGALRRAGAVLDARPDVHLTCGRTRLRPAAGRAPLGREAEGEWRTLDGDRALRRLCALARNDIGGPTAIVRTAIQKEVGHYRAELPHTDDLEMWLRFTLKGGVAATDAYQAEVAVHAGSQSASVADILRWNMEFEAAFRCFFRNEGAGRPDADALLAAALSTLGERAFCSALTTLARGEGGARALLRYSARLRGFPRAALPPFGYALRRLAERRRAGGGARAAHLTLGGT